MTSTDPHSRSDSLIRIAGIDVRIHWTFLVLLVWIFFSHVVEGHGVPVALEGVAFIAVIFSCVVLHELGHALVARRFGVRTRDITLYPIGGVARLQKMPERPAHELAIAIAGPAVNFAIAGALWLAVGSAPRPETLVGGSFIAKVMYVNLSIGLFNLLPAFPMDGGRVLRALLALKVPYVRATQIAASAGKTLAVLLGLLGLISSPFLMFIALFVFVAAHQEEVLVQMRAALQGIPVSEAMLTRFEAIDAATPLSDVIALLMASEQEDFPVMQDGAVAGVLTRTALLRVLASGARDVPVRTVMTQTCNPAEPSEMLDTAFLRMQEAGCTSLPVLRRGELVGLLTLEHIGKWIMLRSAFSRPADGMHRRAQGVRIAQLLRGR